MCNVEKERKLDEVTHVRWGKHTKRATRSLMSLHVTAFHAIQLGKKQEIKGR